MTNWQEQFVHLRKQFEAREQAEQERLRKRRDELRASLLDLERAAEAEAEIARLREKRELLADEVATLQAEIAANRRAAFEAQQAEVSSLSSEIERLMKQQEGQAVREQFDDVARLFADLHFDLNAEPLSALRAKLHGGSLRNDLLAGWINQLKHLDARLSQRDDETGRDKLTLRRLGAETRISTAQDKLRTENSVTNEVLESLRGFDTATLRRFLEEVVAPYEADLVAEQSWQVPTAAGTSFPALRPTKVP